MKKIIILLAMMSGTSHASGQFQAEIFGADVTVVCQTNQFEVTMKSRAPRIGEFAVVFTQSNQTFVAAKVDVTVTPKSGEPVQEFIVDDATDPWESASPIFQAEDFTFYAQDPGRPITLKLFGKELRDESQCQF